MADTPATRSPLLSKIADTPSAVYFRCQGGDRHSVALDAFQKDILRVGRWIHPVHGYEVTFERPDLEAIASETNRMISNGHKVPFPDGHTTAARENMGHWSRFWVEGDVLMGELSAAEAEKHRVGDAIQDVSAYIHDEILQGTGETYGPVLEHVCGTSYPVIESQGNFVKLSRDGDEVRVPVLELDTVPADRGLTHDEMLAICPSCAETMAALGMSRVQVDPAKAPADLAAAVRTIALQAFTDAERECISEKTAEGVRDGRDEDQAVAIAIRTCAPEKARSMSRVDFEVARIFFALPEGAPMSDADKIALETVRADNARLAAELEARRAEIDALEAKRVERDRQDLERFAVALKEDVASKGEIGDPLVRRALEAIERTWASDRDTAALLGDLLRANMAPARAFSPLAPPTTKIEAESKLRKAEIQRRMLLADGYQVTMSEDGSRVLSATRRGVTHQLS